MASVAGGEQASAAFVFVLQSSLLNCFEIGSEELWTKHPAGGELAYGFHGRSPRAVACLPASWEATHLDYACVGHWYCTILRTVSRTEIRFDFLWPFSRNHVVGEDCTVRHPSSGVAFKPE